MTNKDILDNCITSDKSLVISFPFYGKTYTITVSLVNVKRVLMKCLFGLHIHLVV